MPFLSHERTVSPLQAAELQRGDGITSAKTVLPFLAGGIVSLTPWATPAGALLLGLIVGLVFSNALRNPSRRFAKVLLQVSVVALGFGMNLRQIFEVGKNGVAYTAGAIAITMFVGLLLGRFLNVLPNASLLISAGTAICGGSAIAAIGPITCASDEEMSVSLGSIFILNSLALLVFPSLGFALHLSQSEFGLWAALAIHDTSSVVGATAKYGAIALAVGTTVKSARALWIVPVALAVAAVKRSKAKFQWPWFVLGFTVAAMLKTYFPSASSVFRQLVQLGKSCLILTLYLIGSGISRTTLKQVGVRPLLQAVALWIMTASSSLWLVKKGILTIGTLPM